jgi:hypothetical protein
VRSATRAGAKVEARRRSSHSDKKIEEEWRSRLYQVIRILEQGIAIIRRNKVWQKAEMREMQRRAKRDGSHHEMPTRSSSPSGTGDEDAGMDIERFF